MSALAQSQIFEQRLFHLLSSEDLAHVRISKASRWSDPVWEFDVDDPVTADKRCHYVVRWDFDLLDGARFTDPRWNDLLGVMRRFVWSWMVDPRDGYSARPGTVTAMMVGMRLLVRWMSEQRYSAISELTSEAVEDYLLYVAEQLGQSADEIGDADHTNTEDDEIFENDTALSAGDTQEAGIGSSQVRNRLFVLKRLYTQGPALQEAGIEPIPSDPFPGGGIGAAVNQIATRAIGWIPPLPDAVAIPIMSSATRFIGAPANDVITLQDHFINAVDGDLTTRRSARATAAISAILMQFDFAVVDGESEPWRGRIESTYLTPPDRTRTRRTLDPISQLRRLIVQVQAAAAIVVQSHVGMRISEICSLVTDGLDPRTGLPSCVSIRRSNSGLNEIFYLQGKLIKLKQYPEDAEWVLGSRPIGSDWIPPPVQALIVLDRLMLPWRHLGGLGSMFVGFSNSTGLPQSGANVIHLPRESLVRYQRSFVAQWVDLSELPDFSKHGEDLRRYRDSLGHMIRSHQWRKTFANFLYRTNAALLQAISQHFKHLSLAMTEQGYIGSDPTLLAVLDAMRAQDTYDLFYEVALGKRLVSGQMSKMIDEHVEELRKMITGNRRRDYEHVREWVDVHDYRIWYQEHGKCLLRYRPEKARCHEIRGTSSWENSAPAYATVSPSVCMTCCRFLVDSQHEEFWRTRFRENFSAYDEARRAGFAGEYRVAFERAKQSAAILRKLSVGQDIRELAEFTGMDEEEAGAQHD